MQNLLLGIDIGTSSCKAALFDPEGNAVCQAKADYPVYYPAQGWAEQDAEDWWRGAAAAVSKLTAKIDPARICAVGIDGQGWSAIPVDAEGAVLARTPIWMDTRAREECREMAAAVGEEALFACCGNPLQPAYTLPKILWMKKHLRGVYERADKILSANAFIGYRLTDAAAEDLSQGYGYNFFDMRRGAYDMDICRALGVRESLLPPLAPCHQIIGRVTKAAAALTGLLEGTPVAAGGLDAACGTLGAGVLHAGETQEQGGQAGGMSICIEDYVADPRLILGFHVVPNKWLLQGGTVGGGGVMRWFEAQFAAAERQQAAAQGLSVFELLNGEAESVPAGSEGLVFLPYMAGERSPIWDPLAKGVFYGLDFSKTRAHLLRAAMEGVALSLRHNLEVARDAGARVGMLLSVGGSANSLVWTQLKSDATGIPISVPASDTATPLGAAMLAGVGTGLYKSFEEAVAKTKRILRRHDPRPGEKPAYDAAYQKYLEIYERLKPMMDRE